MIDALLYAVRDGIRAAGMNYGVHECDIRDSGKPKPECGNVYVAVHDGKTRSVADNQLNEVYDFAVTLTMRVTIPADRIGDQLLARNLALVPLAQRQGFNAKIEQLRTFLHMNWAITVLRNQTPNSANDNLASWGFSTNGADVYGFYEPARYRGTEVPSPVGDEWFEAEPTGDNFGIKAQMRFEGAKRLQPVLLPSGPFV